MIFYDGFDLFLQFRLNGFQHLINVCIMEIKCGTIDIHFFYQFFYGNFFQTFCLHQFCKSGSQLGFCFSDSPVSFLFHDFFLSAK